MEHPVTQDNAARIARSNDFVVPLLYVQEPICCGRSTSLCGKPGRYAEQQRLRIKVRGKHFDI
jgi:hypothetical protein